ncbi:hypothetical protein [Sporomusa acidovorans]|uniref:Uncharacterized protein n=1 Tax=Sporomusa acidovorans (strain ATCC 49682 / DSM 3132 / Mol) TaxID=1123286 RepID=A0ABZ3IWB8_SPOA4|nr:hypothetical protein [Sporomusa acidovorans]OZC23658.1 hypothetical protein SPACI_05600 [Sporomusa acidovorans DSM 3132]SDE24114.1 hypothetical protein SAMN04488499_101086 [Sporomusa acidovorans]
MKKFIGLFVLVVLFCLTSTSEAKISRQYDSFSDYYGVSSIVSNIGDLNRIVFAKGYTKNSTTPNYMLTLAKYTHDNWWFFSSNFLEIKIGDAIKSLPVYRSDSQYIKDNGYLPFYTNTHIMFPNEVISKLKDVDTVTLRIYFDNQPSVDLVVPQKVLAEWQEVIAAEK